jgi:hypothetical protein
LGVSHYPSLAGKGEAGATDRMYIDGNRFKIAGTFLAEPLGKALFEAVRGEQQLIKRNEARPEQPIRISAGWWDLAHKHGDFIFERKSLFDVCPMCEQGAGGKVYLKGQLDHFAATRVPINPRTPLTLEEKAMTKTTRKADAASIIGEELAEELEQETKPIGKSESELPEAMVTKADKRKKPLVDDEDEDDRADKEIMDEDDEEAKVEKETGKGQWFKKRKADVTNWSTFSTVLRSILDQDDPALIKEQAGQLLDEFGAHVDAVKAAVEAAVMIDDEGGLPTMADETIQAGIEETVNDILADDSLGRTEKLEAIQAAFNEYGETVKAQLDLSAPPDAGETLKAALMPVIEKLDLISQRLTGPAAPQGAAQAQPQQKSFVPKSAYSGEPEGLQKPPSLRDIVRKSVGIQ